MDHPHHFYDSNLNTKFERHVVHIHTISQYAAYTLLALYVANRILVYYDYPILSLPELLWNALVYLIPQRLLLNRARRQQLQANGMLSETHAAKSEALRRVLGMGGQAVLQKLPGEGIMRRMSGVGKQQPASDAPPGLGNWDNSCYQNSVLQGLASLDSFKEYLGTRGEDEEEGTTTRSLQEFVGKLNDQMNNGKHLWTPAKLKNMSSWQQQDAQEYFSKMLDELDKEALKSLKDSAPKPGLESLAEEPPQDEHSNAEVESSQENTIKNPLDGLLAQRVACTKCGYSEGLSMIPFNCLTLPLGSSQLAYPLEQCLDEYTKLEEIPDVECPKCTLLRAEQQLTKLLPSPPSYRSTDAQPAIDSRTLALPPELRAQAFQRLAAMQRALDEDDFADKTLHETCQIPKKARVSSTKTRQAVVGRAPQSLVLHMNRSVFEETTGIQRKNYASVRWPSQLDMSSWTLPTDGSEDTEATASLLTEMDDGNTGAETGLRYRIKAVVTHTGRHENGHYICYRQHPVRIRVEEELDGVEEDGERRDGALEMRWWRLSDEDITSVSEDEVLKEGGVFMLFYEREHVPEIPARKRIPEAIVTDAESTTADSKITSTAVVERTIQNDTSTPANIETEQPAQAKPNTPEPSPPIDTEPSSTNPTTPGSVITDSTSPFDESVSSADVTKHDESEAEPPKTPHQTMAKHHSPSPELAMPVTPPMRTARSQRPESPPGSTNKDGGFGVGGNGFRAVAAT